MSNNLPGTGIVRRMQERESRGAQSFSGEDPEVRRKMELMTGHLANSGNDPAFSREKARECAERAHRRKRG